MDFLGGFWHLLNFCAPAAGLALVSSSIAKLLWLRELKGVSWLRLAGWAAGWSLVVAVGGLIVFGRDGKSVIALGDKKVMRWNLDEDAWRTAACRIANRALTPSEWAEAFPEEPYRKTCPPDAR